MALMNGFDQLCALLERALLRDIASKLPPNPKWAEQWLEPGLLHWFGVSVDTEQDGRLYTAYSFGKVKNHVPLYRENLSTDRFDYDGLDRARMQDADEEQYFALRSAMAARREEQDADDDDDEDRLDPKAPTLLALALVLARLRTTPGLFPMPTAPGFFVTLSDDVETATWPVTLATLARADFGSWTTEQLDRFWGDSPHAAIARRVHALVAEKRELDRSLSAFIQ